jgi:hypothetical protein
VICRAANSSFDENIWMTNFNLEILQTLNDWQKGGDPTKKGIRLVEVTQTLPDRFKSCHVPCYRQEAHEKDRTWRLIADKRLPERVAAWTTDLSVAKTFKGGVPPPGLHGVIFRIDPPPGSVVLNLNELYRDPEFVDALNRLKGDITGFHDGIGRYGANQAEVILELDLLDDDLILSYGGFIGTLEQIGREMYQREPTAAELAELDSQLRKLGCVPGDQWWLNEKCTRAVLGRIEPHLDRLRKKKAP